MIIMFNKDDSPFSTQDIANFVSMMGMMKKITPIAKELVNEMIPEILSIIEDTVVPICEFNAKYSRTMLDKLLEQEFTRSEAIAIMTKRQDRSVPQVGITPKSGFFDKFFNRSNK